MVRENDGYYCVRQGVERWILFLKEEEENQRGQGVCICIGRDAYNKNGEIQMRETWDCYRGGGEREEEGGEEN